MLNSECRAELDKIKVSVNRTFNYGRSDGGGTDEADLTLEFENGQTMIHGTVQTIDELEYAVARLIATARKEVGHGKAVQPTRELAWKS